MTAKSELIGLLPRRSVLKGGLGLLALTLPQGGQAASGSGFPDHTVTVICPFTPGGINDLCARTVAQAIEQRFHRSAIVENKPGASTIIGLTALSRSAPDGHTLLTCSDRIVCFPTIGKTPFDVEHDFAPVTRLIVSPMFLVTRRGLGPDSVKSLIALAKGNPNLTFASTGSGSTTHITGARFKAQVGVDMVHVPYKGALPAISDVVSGHIDLMFADLGTAAPFIQSGQVKALAVASTSRSKRFPDIPTFTEAGVEGFEASLWIGLLARAGTPANIIAEIHEAVVAAFKDPITAMPILNLGPEIATDSPAECAALIERERARIAPILKAENIHL